MDQDQSIPVTHNTNFQIIWHCHSQNKIGILQDVTQSSNIPKYLFVEHYDCHWYKGAWQQNKVLEK